MEVVPALSDSSPFQRRDVAEWSHMDRLTGMMETARVETDRWAASTSTSAHSYGKVVDSRNRSLPDGSAQQRQRQQLEVFQTKGPGGSLQVIRTQSVTSTNSSWRGTSLVGSRAPLPAITQDFGNLQLTLNPLDISSEKSKGSVGRSGSIGGRRPPSRPRSIVGKVVVPLAIEEDAVSSRLSQVSRICQQVHDEKKKTAFTANDRALKNISSLRELTSSTSSRSSISEITNGHSSIIRKKSSSIEDLHNDGSEEHDDKDEVLTRSAKVRRSLQFPLKKLEARGGVSKLLQDLEDSNNKRNTPEGRIARKSFEALENVLKRGNSIVDSIHKSETEDSESILTGSETSGEYSNKHTVNNINLDSFSRRFSDANKISIEKRHSYIDALDSREEQDSSTDEGKNKSPATKRHSFVTVESLKEVRGRLKRLNSPLDGLDTESGMEEADDGIEAEESTKTLKEVVSEVPQSRVKSYVYGMEAMSQNGRQPVAGTGSLESRTSKNSSNSSRSDEWYNRRKSYGFEQVTGAQRNDSSSTLSSKGDESKLESTDSGICRSSEMFNVPSWNRKLPSNMLWNKSGETDVLNVSHSIHIKRDKGEENVNGDENNEGVQRRRSTIVNFDSKSEQRKDEAQSNKVTDVLRRSSGSGKMLSALLVNGVRSDDSDESGRQQYVTVSIPIVHDDSSPTVGSRRLFYQQLTQGTTLSVDKSLKKSTKTIDDQSPSYNGSRVLGDDWWMKPNRGSNVYSDDSKLGNEDWRTPSKLSSALKRHSFAEGKSWKNLNGNENVHEGIESESRVGGSEDWHRPSQLVDSGMKRHSIAVDELKYVKENKPVAGFSVTFAQQSREDTDNLILKKHKKVEFCKTEVHFAAEPGRINIVETDEKPPSTNMFRRRRRNSNPTPDAPKTSNLPEVRFGDSIYEKQLLGGNEEIQDVVKSTRPTTLRLNRQEDTFQDKEDQVYTQANATIRAHHTEEEGDEIDENNDYESSHVSKPRSILKSYTKPLLYHLGDEDSTSSPVEDEQEKWGVRLRPVVQERSPVWKSTVTLSSRDDVMPVEYSGQSELQKLLRSLRPANQNKQEQIVVARHSGSVKSSEKLADWSVAERIRHVEQVASESKGFSTRVNFGGGEATVVDDEQSSTNGGQNQRLFQISDRPKPVWQRREEALISSDGSKHFPGKRKNLASQNGHNCFDNNVIQFQSKDISPSLELQRRNNTTTTITIDLTPSPTSNENNRINMLQYQGEVFDKMARPEEILHSPSLILKSMHNSLASEEEVRYNHKVTRPILNSQQEYRRRSNEIHSNSFVNGDIQIHNYTNENFDWIAERNLKTNQQTNSRRHSMAIGDRGIADGEGSPNNRACMIEEEAFRKTIDHLKSWEFMEERGRCEDEDVVVASSLLAHHNNDNSSSLYNDSKERNWGESEASERGCAEEVVIAGQLDAWRALYCDIDSDLSDDSEKADEEVRSYMSAEGEGGSSEVSGSWSRATALRHFQKHEQQEYTTGYSVCAPSEEGHDPQRTHSSVATAVLPNYGDAGRLRAVETLVSTRSGHPKITSISLRYDEEQNNTARHSASDAFKFTSRTSISPERRNSSYNETETAFISKDNPTYLEPSYRSKQPLFSQIVTKPNENNSTNSSSKSETYSIKSQYKNTRERKTFTDKNESEDMTNYIPERQMLPPAKLTVISAESPATTITSKVSAFEKQHVSTRSSQSSPAARTTTHSPSTVALNFDPISSHSSSRIVSSFESKMSNSSNSRRSQSPVITDHSYQHISPRYSSSPSNQPSPKPEDKQDKTFTGFDSPTVALELKQTQDTSPSRYISRDRKATESHQVDVKSKLTSSQVECELGTVTKAMSRSPSPTKKVTSPSKNSINKDFIGRVRSESPIYQNKERSSNQNKMIPSKTSLKDITEKSVKSGSQSPIYQNKEVYTSERNRKSSRSNHPVVEPETRLTECGLDAVETDSAILEELTRAADQILQAVNGYTDEESRRASSDDEEHSRKTTEGRVLGTIAEKPSSQKHTDGKKESIKMNGNVRKIQRTVSKTKLGPTSSTSSVESLSRESRRALLKSEKASSSTTSRSATSSRTARMVQRASSRELLLQAHASSSEDVASGTDTKKPRAPPPRRTRTSSSHTNKVSTSSASKSREKQPSEAKEPARSTRERISVSKVKSRDTTTSSLDSSRKTPLTKQYPVKEKNIPGVCNSTPGRDRSSSSRTTTTTRTKKSVSASRHEGASTSSKVTK